jgi:hypothetical protein
VRQDGRPSPQLAAVFFEAADELILSVICSHLDMRSLCAIAQALHPFRQPAAQERQVKVIEMLARVEPGSRATIIVLRRERPPATRMLLRMKRFDSTSAAKHAPVLPKVLFEHADYHVRLEYAPCA